MYSNLPNVSDGMPEIRTDVTKNNSVPSVAGGILWPDTVNKIFYSFGGYFPQIAPKPFVTWSYKTDKDRWDSVKTKGDRVSYVAHGMGTVAPDNGVGYYLGGYHSGQTEDGWGPGQLYTTNLISFDMVSRQYKNMNGPDQLGRGEGAMVFIPVSRSGLLIFFGGVAHGPRNRTIKGVCLEWPC
jgi:hypothetical protein